MLAFELFARGRSANKGRASIKGKTVKKKNWKVQKDLGSLDDGTPVIAPRPICS
jgi:hypothetical protein